MSVHTFTEAEIEQLRTNQYTATVTPLSISYTEEFKKLFWERYSRGEGITKIFKSCGYDTNVLGRARVNGFAYRMAKDNTAGVDIHENVRQRSLQGEPELMTLVGCQKEIIKLREENAMVRQELEYVKKISSLINLK